MPTRQIADLDALLEGKRRELAETVDPDDRCSVRESIDDLLEARHAITTTRRVGG
jgi:hypothetical protein